MPHRLVDASVLREAPAAGVIASLRHIERFARHGPPANLEFDSVPLPVDQQVQAGNCIGKPSDRTLETVGHSLDRQAVGPDAGAGEEMLIAQLHGEVLAPRGAAQNQRGKARGIAGITGFLRQQVDRSGGIDAHRHSTTFANNGVAHVAHGTVAAGHADVGGLGCDLRNAAATLAQQDFRAVRLERAGQRGNPVAAVPPGRRIAEDLHHFTQEMTLPASRAPPPLNRPQRIPSSRCGRARRFPYSRSRDAPERFRPRDVILDGCIF